MRQEFKPMSWLVKNFDCNAQKIKDYDVLKYREDDIKKLKKKCATKEEFAEALKRNLMYQFWSRAEYELIIKQTDDGHIWLSPWCGCRNPKDVAICVDDDEDFDWKAFSGEHISKQIYKNEAKISVWDQLEFRWDNFVDYCWNYHHKWQRTKKYQYNDIVTRQNN